MHLGFNVVKDVILMYMIICKLASVGFALISCWYNLSSFFYKCEYVKINKSFYRFSFYCYISIKSKVVKISRLEEVKPCSVAGDVRGPLSASMRALKNGLMGKRVIAGHLHAHVRSALCPSKL